MALKKYASFVKLSAIIDNEVDYNRIVTEMSSTAGHDTHAQKVVRYNPDFVYARFKAIGCLEVDGPNANADAFPYPEFLDRRPGYGYQSFIGKHAYVEHASNNIENAIGDLYGSYLNRFNVSKFNDRDWMQLADDERHIVLTSRQPHEDGSVEVLMAVDRKAAPRIARMIDTDSPTGCSMGTNIDYSECTVCGNRAYIEEDYCPHIKFSKGQRLLVPAQQISDLVKKGTLRTEWLPFILSRAEDLKAVKTAGRKMVYAKAFEVNYGLSFFELSVVANPAFYRGYKVEKIASKIKKPSFRQLKPLVYMGNHPVEVVFSVSDDFYNDVLHTYAQNINKPVDSWTFEEQLLFDRDGEIAKVALQSGNVFEVLANKSYAPYFVENNVNLVPSDNAGFYNIENPEELFSHTFASIKSRKICAAVGTETENYYACANCKGVFNQKTDQKVATPDISKFKKFAICIECEQVGVNKMAKEVTGNEEGAELGLPTTSEFTGDKDVEAREGETKLYHDWADKGAKLIGDEKEYRPMGTIFIDAVVAKKSLSDRSARVKELKTSVITLLNRVKLALESPADFIKEMKGSGAGPGAGPGAGAGPMGGPPPVMPKMEGAAIEISLESADIPTVLENSKKDLLMIKEDLEDVADMLEGKEGEAKEALANRLRWGKRNAFGAKKLAEDADAVIEEAVSAVEDAVVKLDQACDIYCGEDKESGEKSKEPEKSKESEKNKLNKLNIEGEKDMSKEARLEITDANIHLLQKLTGIVSKSLGTVAKDETEDKEEKKEEAKEEKKEEAKEEKKEEKEEKKEEKEEKKEEKKAAAMPPTGARDPGNYGEPGAVESVEMNAWWKQQYPEFERMKGEERSKSLNDPETKIELLTGPLTGGEDASADKRPGEAPKAPTVYSGAIIVRKFANMWEPRKTFYGVVKVAEDGVVDAFVADFNDVAGSEGGQEEFNTFTSSDYATEIVNSVKQTGVEATRKLMNGKIAQLEGITPGKTSKTPNALYDTQEAEKASNKERPGMRPEPKDGHKSDDKYYGQAFGDKEYATALKNANTKIASLEGKVADYELQMKSDLIAKRALHLARIAASRGVCPFDLLSIQKQAMEYIPLDERGLNAVKANLEKLPVVNQRALEAYQIPEAEEMGSGVVHNNLSAVRNTRYDGHKAEDIAPEGIQDSVHQNAKVTADQQEKIRKQAHEVVPQMHAEGGTVQGDNGIPDVTKHFNTIENRLRRVGKLEQYKHLLRSNRRH